MAFGREGSGRLGYDSSVYTSRQDSSGSASNAPHWMRQLEEKYQRLHAKIINQAAKFSNARFNAVNNSINQYRNLSISGVYRSGSVSKSSAISSSAGGDGVHAILAKRGSSLSSSAAFTGKRELCDNIDTNNHFRRGIQTGNKRRNNRDKQMVWEGNALENNGIDPLPAAGNIFKRSNNTDGDGCGGGGGSADSEGQDDHLTSSVSPPPPGSSEVNTHKGPLRPAGDVGRVTQAEICDPVRATLAKTSAAIALLNSSPANPSSAQSRRGGKCCTAGSRPKSPRQARLRQQTFETQHAHEDDGGRLSETVYYIPAGIGTSGGGHNNSNIAYCFEKEVSGGVSTQHTPRASKPTTRASSSLALTRLSSANFVSGSRTQSPLHEEAEVNNNCAQDAETLEKSSKFFTKRHDPFVTSLQQQIHDNGYVDENRSRVIQTYGEDDGVDCKNVNSEYDSYEEDSDYSGDYEEDVFLDEHSSVTEDCVSQKVRMEVAKTKGRRHASRPIRPSVSRLGQKPHKSCPTYFWKSANPNASTNEDEEERERGRALKIDDKAGKYHPNSKKTRKTNLRKKDRRGIKSHDVRKSNTNYNMSDNIDNNDNIIVDGDDNKKETRAFDENDNDSLDNDPHDNIIHHNDTSQQQYPHQHRNKPRSDSKGTISPVLGTVLPLTARAVEEGRMRVFARMSLEARHAVDETLREMEREEEKWGKEKAVGKTTDILDSARPATIEKESTMDLSVMNNVSGTCAPSRGLDRDRTEDGHDQDRIGEDGGDSQDSFTSNNPQNDFYAPKKFYNSNPNLLQTKNLTDFTHSPSSSISANKRSHMAVPRASSRRLPHLSDLAAPVQTSSLPNPHARLPGIGSKPHLPLSYRETTFEITPPDFDIRFHHIISCQTEGRETPPPDIRQQSIDKCQQWLIRHNPR
ncbi:hypothetical protein ElyMa_003886400 [Elysia marginata]|uniref:Uncharacterized protein n=1 Tax=Elysia marginata TaxID=1093978 RepID=A0AAV4FMI2_9GAST|nr:hypothetical protein ElyMa_003886400 [Elysia marginata]